MLTILAACINAISMNFNTLAFQHDKSAFVSSVMLIQVVYAFMIDIFWFKTSFVAMELIGALIVVAFNGANIYNKIKIEQVKN